MGLMVVVIRGHGDEEGVGLVAWLSSVCLEGFEERERYLIFFQAGCVEMG